MLAVLDTTSSLKTVEIVVNNLIAGRRLCLLDSFYLTMASIPAKREAVA